MEPTQFTLDAVKHDADIRPDRKLSISTKNLAVIIIRAEAAEARAAQLQAERDALAAELELVKAEWDRYKQHI